MQFISKRIFGLVGDWTYTLYINLSQIISFMVIQFVVVPSTYFAVDVLSELSMVVSFVSMPSWRVNICLYSQLQNAVCFSLVASLFQKYLVGTNCIHFCMTRCSVQASVGNCQLFYCGTSKPALEIIGGLMVK